MRHRNYEGPGNPVEACTEVIAGKWKGEILYLLLNGSKRHGELRRLIPKVTQRMLTNQLRELEAAGIVKRRVMEGIPLPLFLNPWVEQFHTSRIYLSSQA